MKPIAKILIGVGSTATIAAVVVVVLSMIPTNVKTLSKEFAPIEDRAGRKPGDPKKCALVEMKMPDGSCAQAASPVTREEEVVFPSSIPDKGLRELKGTLTLSSTHSGPGKRAAVILLHGSGPTERDGKAPGDLVSRHAEFAVLKSLAALLASQGLVVLRWDKRHCLKCYPGTKPDPKTVSWLDLDVDARDALRYMKTRPEVDPDGLVVAGHSEGGQLAPHVGFDSAGVVAVMMLGGLVETFDVGLVNQLRRFADIRSGQGDILSAWQLRRQATTFDNCFALIPKDPNSNKGFCAGIPFRAWTEFINYGKKTEERLLNLKPALFALQGSVDRNIDPVTIPRIQKLLAGRAESDFEVHYVPEVNHDLVNVINPPVKPELDASVKARMVGFVTSVKH
jgi:uncharacterized protein